jgi:hypothetical protein
MLATFSAVNPKLTLSPNTKRAKEEITYGVKVKNLGSSFVLYGHVIQKYLVHPVNIKKVLLKFCKQAE